jgi:hypothetical protein
MILSLLFAAQIAVTSPGTTPQTQPWVDVDLQQAVVVWLEEAQVRFSRIRFDGTRLDNGRVVATRGINPRIASNGVNHLIVWVDNSDVLGRFLSPDGTFLGDAFQITDLQTVDFAAVAWVGSRYVVVWSGPNAGAAEVTASQAIDTFQIFGTDKTIVGDLSVAPAGGDVMVAYNTQDSATTFPITTTISTLLWQKDVDPPAPPNVIASRVTGVGNAALIYARTPRIAANGAGFLLGWTQQNGPGRGSYAFLARIDSEGKKVGDPVMVGSSFGSTSFPDAIANPADDRVFSVDYPQFVEGKVDFTCGCVSKQTLANAPTSVAPSFENFSAAPLPAGGIVVAYEYGTREEGEPFTSARPRVFVQFLDVPPPPIPPPPRVRPSRH